MRLSSRLGYGDGFVKSVERVVKLEEVGLDVVWVAEAYGNDAATRLGYLAARTHRVELASGIFPIYSRTPHCWRRPRLDWTRSPTAAQSWVWAPQAHRSSKAGTACHTTDPFSAPAKSWTSAA